MSDVQSGKLPVAAPSPTAVSTAAPSPVKREQAEKFLTEVLKLLDVTARLELKDLPDGGISIALFFEGEVPGVQNGKRSHLIDSLQFLANKVVNRPNTERRWITLGVGGHAPPRAPAPVAALPAPVAAPVPNGGGASLAVAKPIAASPPAVKPPPQTRPAPVRAVPSPAAAASVNDESKLEVTPDPKLEALAQLLAKKSATLGRVYAIAPMKPEDRARIMRAAAGVPGVTVRCEGEGRSRRLVFQPEKPTPMPKKAIVDYGDDDEA
jgi:predicted RNA-binding protein Jag